MVQVVLAYATYRKIGKGAVKIKNEIREGEKHDSILISEEESERTIVSTDGYLIILSTEDFLIMIFTLIHMEETCLRTEHMVHIMLVT